MSADNQKGPVSHGPIEWMARNSIAANLLMIILLAGGLYMAFAMQKEVFPEFEIDVVEVDVRYPGASPEEVEQGILQPIESSVRGVQGIKEMTSEAREGWGRVSLELVAGADRMKAFQEVDQAVNRVRTFPDDAEDPEVRIRDNLREVMEVGLYGDIDVWSLRKLAENLRDRLLTEPEITQVDLGWVPGYLTHVEIPREQLRRYNLTLGEVARMIEASGRDVPAGSVETSRGEILLRMNERKQWAEEFAGIPVVTTESGARVTLGDIANIDDGFEETGFHSQFNKQPSVEVNIFRVGNQSPLEISAAVERVLKELDTTLPEGVHHRIDSNNAEDFSDRLMLLLGNGGLAILIVLTILTIFLELRLAFWIMMGMTISFVGGVLFMPALGVSINMISMFAFLVVLGIVVDDAIVVGENIYEYRQRGYGRLQAAISGTKDIASPVTFTILTTVVAFIPVMFIPGTTGKFWWPFPVVVITVLLISLVEALFILPAHLAESGKGRKGKLENYAHDRQQALAKKFNAFVQNRYRPFVEKCIRVRYFTISVVVSALIIAGAYGTSDHMGMVMMPRVAADEIEAGVRLPVGTTLEQAAEVANAITEQTHEMFEKHDLYKVAEGIKSNVRGKSFIDVEIVMLPPDERDVTAREVIELWRNEIGDIEGVDQITFEAERGPGGWRDDLSVDLSHTNTDLLAEASQVFKARMEEYANTRNVNDNYNKGKLQYNFTLRPEGELLGLTPTEVGRQVRDAFYGAVAIRQLRGTNEIEVRVKLPLEERRQQHTLDDLIIRTPSGTEVPLYDVAEPHLAEAFSSLSRRNGRRVINVGMDVEPQSALGQVSVAMKEQVLPQLRAEYPGLTWTFRGSESEMRESTQVLWGGFGMAMFVIYSLLAIAFRSYLQPLIVMIAIPFGIIGVVIGHLMLGYDLSLVSLMGIVALSGVVVNGSLIMVDHANKTMPNYENAYQAICDASVRRFRPIFLTTLTTFGGLSPIIMETSRQAAQLIPMAISLGFGIVFASAIVLIVVPCFFMVLDDLKRWRERANGEGHISDDGGR
ncbi:efflux RND transporter permease subunit [Gilvimarinus sp. SDUM040013]|uniref:Efflux RND transporter permease subunit n=1 Tax=Gilvimarinus gilvus TaxID=3058038 RepID=A0ABU4RTK4_9GAMM|nr:efflux RND transporter permease subunit [Gilvimarinus sp. SDUM040013]MDO3386851.1 efflux RND transporter permease subunit [Gilvimarinus sp. SDUM040013]MDX6848219.1 efflux RND transporter permease subunit [Gilvimarinus sp. SDUM040013]